MHTGHNAKPLQIKEIGYINATGYSSSALRHGPFALLEEGTPVILITPNDKYFSKNIAKMTDFIEIVIIPIPRAAPGINRIHPVKVLEHQILVVPRPRSSQGSFPVTEEIIGETDPRREM